MWKSSGLIWSALPVIRRLTGGATSRRDPMPFSAMPGPKPLPLIGNSWELRNNLDRLRLYYQEGFNKFGDIYRLKGIGDYMVLVKDPSTIEKVLRAEGKYPIRDRIFTPRFAWLFKNATKKNPSMVFSDGEKWKELRSAMGKQIMPRNVQMWHQSYNDIISKFTEYVRSSKDVDGTMKDITFPITRLLIELSAMTTFGSSWDVVANPADKEKEFAAAVRVLMRTIAQLPFEPPLYKIFDTKLSREFKTAFKVIEQHSITEADRIFALINAGKESTNPGLFEQWLRERKLSEEEALLEAMSVFSAGVETTSNQAVFLLHSIAANEDVQEKLYREIKTVLGDHELPLPDHLSKMPFMKGCLLESYRLYSTSPISTRVLTEDTELHGYQVPANTTVMYSIYSAGRDASLFPDPLKFDPDRWRRDDTHAFAIQPFGFGPRSCYGRRFAELEMKLLLIQMVYNFELRAEKELEVVERLVVAPKGNVTIKFTERKAANTA